MEWIAGQSITVSERNNSTSSVFITGKEDEKRVSIKIVLVTGTETTSTPNPRRDESSVDTDNYVMQWTAEQSVTVSKHSQSKSSVFVTGKEDKKRVR